MKTVKVTYTVKPSFVEQNKENVATFINDLKKLNNPDLRYGAFLKEDGKTFVHISSYKNEETQKVLFELPSFREFQKQRDSSGLELEPQIETLAHIATTAPTLD